VLSLGLEIGPWLREFKQALFNHQDSDTFLEICSGKGNNALKRFKLGDLANRIAMITPGQKITYIADAVYNKSESEKMSHFAKDSDHLFIEAAFLEKDRHIAREKYHLTAWQAGTIAGRARAKQFTLFHFSPRYMGHINRLEQEAKAAYLAAIGGTDNETKKDVA
jgi:ribonuclease Z